MPRPGTILIWAPPGREPTTQACALSRYLMGQMGQSSNPLGHPSQGKTVIFTERFDAIPIKIPTSYLVDIDKLLLTLHRKEGDPKKPTTVEGEEETYTAHHHDPTANLPDQDIWHWRKTDT